MKTLAIAAAIMLSVQQLETRLCAHGGVIHAGHGDAIPDYAHQPDTVTVQAGGWFDPATWSHGVPDAGMDARVRHAVTLPPSEPLSADFDDSGAVDWGDLRLWWQSFLKNAGGDANGDGVTDAYDLIAWQEQQGQQAAPAVATVEDVTIEAGGSLAISGALEVQTLLSQGGLDVTGSVTIRDLPFDYTLDPQQFGHGIIVLGAGWFHADGATFASENPAGVRGHVMASERVDVRITDSVFRDMGRTTMAQLDNTHLGAEGQPAKHIGTNQVGRYALHLHHLYGREGLAADAWQYEVSRNEFHDSAKWALAVHNTHYGLVEGNLIDGAEGSGLVLEDGNEYGNLIAHNTIRNIRGSGEGVQGRNNGLPARLVGDGTAENPYRTVGDHGHEGAGIWVRGVASDFVGNVVENAPFGVVVWARFQGSEGVPAYKGADPHVASRPLERGTQDGHAWRDNVVRDAAIGMSMQGLSEDVQEDFLIENQSLAGITQIGVDTSYSHSITFRGGVFEPRAGARRPIFVQPGHNKLLNIDGGATVRGWYVGFNTHAGGHVGESYFERNVYDVIIEYERGNSTGDHQPWTIEIDGARFDDQVNNITYRLSDYFNLRDYSVPLYVVVNDYNGTDADYQLYAAASRADYVPPTGNATTNRGERISPVAGLTNQQLFDRYLRPSLGFVAPADAHAVPGINALAASPRTDREGPRLVGAPQVTVTGTTAVIRFTTDEPARYAAEYNAGEIGVERWTNLLPASTEYRTEHEIVLRGLRPSTKYQYTLRLADEAGNLTVPRMPGLWYSAYKFATE